MTITTALEEAHWVYSRIDQYDKQDRFDAAVSLGEWKMFSLRQIARIVDMPHTTVAGAVQAKGDKTGGRFDPEALEPLMALAIRRRKSEPLDPQQVAEAIDAGLGTSLYMASRLTGIPRSHLMRRYAEAGQA